MNTRQPTDVAGYVANHAAGNLRRVHHQGHAAQTVARRARKATPSLDVLLATTISPIIQFSG